MDCSIQARTTGEIGDNLFPESRLYLTLAKVQCYLEKFLLNKDKLKVCWEIHTNKIYLFLACSDEKHVNNIFKLTPNDPQIPFIDIKTICI